MSPPALNSLRIVHVVVTDSFAGTERYVCDVSRELARRGHEVRVVGGSPTAMPATLDGVPWVAGASTADATRALASAGRADVVHSHLPKGDFAAFFARPVSRGAHVATRHITSPRGYSVPAQRFGRLVRRTISAEIAISDYVAGAVDSHVDVVVLNGVRPVQDTARDLAGSRMVVAAQRLEREKDLETVLAAWAACGLGDRGWTLAVAGTGPDLDALRARSDALGIAASVRFLGWVEDLAALLRDAAVFVAAAPREPCGLSVLEAMAHGLPVVAAGAAGHLETVGRAEGALLFPPGDAASCGQLLVGLAESAERRASYGAELLALQRAEFTIETHVDRLEAVYASVLARRGRARP